MLLQWPRRGTTLSLVEAIADDVEAILERTGADVPPLRVSISGSSRPCQLVGDQIVLDEGLLGPDLHVGPDAARAATTPALALDRFRRATGLVAEGALIHAAAARIGQPVEALRDAFWSVGPAAEALDRAAPALGWLWPSLADLLSDPTSSLGQAPRRAGWWFRFLAIHSATPPDPSQVDPVRWASFGSWLRDRRSGPAARCPVPLELARAHPVADLPEVASSLSHIPVALPGGAVGARWTTAHGVLHGSTAPAAGRTAQVVLGNVTAAPVALASSAPGPVGSWALASGHFGTRIGAARGVELHLHADGGAELTGADAFVGPPTRAVLELAEQFGVSGSAAGSWHLTESQPDGTSGSLALRGLEGDAAVHPRKGGGFALPAGDWLEPVRAVLAMLDGRQIAWTLETDGRLILRVDLSGTEMAFTFERVQ